MVSQPLQYSQKHLVTPELAESKRITRLAIPANPSALSVLVFTNRLSQAGRDEAPVHKYGLAIYLFVLVFRNRLEETMESLCCCGACS